MKKNKSGKKTIAVLILIILIVAGILAVKISKNQEIPQTVAKEKQEETPVPEVKKVQIVNEKKNISQKDSKFERMIQDMTVNQLSGKSSLNKFRHKFK